MLRVVRSSGQRPRWEAEPDQRWFYGFDPEFEMAFRASALSPTKKEFAAVFAPEDRDDEMPAVATFGLVDKDITAITCGEARRLETMAKYKSGALWTGSRGGYVSTSSGQALCFPSCW